MELTPKELANKVVSGQYCSYLLTCLTTIREKQEQFNKRIIVMLDKSESDIRKMHTSFKISQQNITEINATDTSNKDAIFRILRGISGFVELKVSQKYSDILNSRDILVETLITKNTGKDNLQVFGASSGLITEGLPLEMTPKSRPGSKNISLALPRLSIDTDKSLHEWNPTDVAKQILIENSGLKKTFTEDDGVVKNVTTHEDDYDDDEFEDTDEPGNDQVPGKRPGHRSSAPVTSEIKPECNTYDHDTKNARHSQLAIDNDYEQKNSQTSSKNECQIQLQEHKQGKEEDIKDIEATGRHLKEEVADKTIEAHELASTTKLDNQSPCENATAVKHMQQGVVDQSAHTVLVAHTMENDTFNPTLITDKAQDKSLENDQIIYERKQTNEDEAKHKSNHDILEAPDMGIQDISPVPTPMPVDWEVSIRPDGSFHLVNCGDIKCFQTYFLASFPRLVAKVDASSGEKLDTINLKNAGNMCKIKSTHHVAVVQFGIGISILATNEDRLRLIYTICTNESFNAICHTVTYEKYPDDTLPDPAFHFLVAYSVHQGTARHVDFINAVTPRRARKTASIRQHKYEGDCKQINLDSAQLHGITCLDAFGENVIVVGSTTEVVCFINEIGSWRAQWKHRFERTVKHIVCSRTKKKVFVYTEACKVLHMLDKQTAELSEFTLPVDFIPDIIDIHKNTLAMTRFDPGCWKSVYIRQNLDI